MVTANFFDSFSGGGGWGDRNLVGGLFPVVEGKKQIFGWWGDALPHVLPVENTLEDDCMLFCYIVWNIESDKVGSPYFAVPY